MEFEEGFALVRKGWRENVPENDVLNRSSMQVLAYADQPVVMNGYEPR